MVHMCHLTTGPVEQGIVGRVMQESSTATCTVEACRIQESRLGFGTRDQSRLEQSRQDSNIVYTIVEQNIVEYGRLQLRRRYLSLPPSSTPRHPDFLLLHPLFGQVVFTRPKQSLSGCKYENGRQNYQEILTRLRFSAKLMTRGFSQWPNCVAAS